MSKDILYQLDQRYTLDSQLHSLNLQLEDTEENLRQAKWDLRCQKQNLVEYESGLRHLLDRLRGKQEEAVENFNREIRMAKERLAALSREQENISYKISKLSQQAENLPTAQQLRDAAQNPEVTAHWARLEIRFCAQMLQPLLEENTKALNEYRDQLRGAKMGEITTHEQLHEIGTAHISWGNQCAALLERIQFAAQHLEVTWEIPGYFQNPNGFIVSAAAKHNRLDRANMALDQISAQKKRIAKILNADSDLAQILTGN